MQKNDFCANSNFLKARTPQKRYEKTKKRNIDDDVTELFARHFILIN